MLGIHTLNRTLSIVCLALALATPFQASATTVPVASITLTTPLKTLSIGAKETLKAVAKDSKGHAISGVKFTWSSSKTTVLRVTAGVVKALAGGSSVIKVSAGTKSASVTIKVPKPTSLTGVAAQGSAIASATITLVDSKGTTISTMTDGSGNYTLNTTGLKPPFLVSVKIDDTHTLYSVSADAEAASVINVNPLTDLIIRSWYSVQGTDVGTAFTNPVASPPPSVAEVQLISNVVVNVTALWLQQNGVDTTQFNPIKTLFTVGDGVDAVLDEATINTDTGAITITDGTTTQNSTVTYNPDTTSMSVATTTTNSDTGDQSSSVTGTVVDTSTDTQTALAGITTALNAFASTVNTRGIHLTATDLLPYLDKGLLDEGLNKTLFADSTADQFRQLSSISFTVQNIVSLDTVNGVADVNFTFTGSQGDQSQSQTVEFFFKQQSDLSWRLSGDQKPAKLGVDSEMRTSQGVDTGDSGPQINVDIRPIQGVYSGITIDGSVFSDVALTFGGTDVRDYTPDPSSSKTVEVDLDEFFANSGVLVDLVPAGTPLTITMTPKTGSPQMFTVKTNAFTTEAISITNLSGSSFASLTLDVPMHVEWTLPKTFAIAQVKLNATVFDGDQTQNTTNSCQVDGPILAITATSGDIDMSNNTQCAGNAVKQVNISVQVIGVNGERENVIYMFQ